MNEVPDEQLLMLSENASGGIAISSIAGDRLIAIEITGDFNVSDIFSARL